MTAIEGRRGLGIASFLRGRRHAGEPPPPAKAVAIRRPVGYLAATDADRVIDGFLAAIHDVDGLRRISARSQGPLVDLIVTVDGSWHEAVDRIEPRVHTLVLAGAVPFDYRVVEAAWGEADPPGYTEILTA